MLLQEDRDERPGPDPEAEARKDARRHHDRSDDSGGAEQRENCVATVMRGAERTRAGEFPNA